METSRAIDLLHALAQDTRLAAWRFLVRAGPEETPAGVIARHLDIAPPVLSFHLSCLARCGLVVSRRHGRHMMYAADLDVMKDLTDFLVEDCCLGFDAPPDPAIIVKEF